MNWVNCAACSSARALCHGSLFGLRLREKKFQKKKAAFPFIPSSTMLKCVVRLKLYGYRRQSVPGDINESGHCALGCVWVFVWCFGFCLPAVLCQGFVTVRPGFVKGWNVGWFLFQMLLTPA